MFSHIEIKSIYIEIRVFFLILKSIVFIFEIYTIFPHIEIKSIFIEIRVFFLILKSRVFML